jgi:hypothetical protein
VFIWIVLPMLKCDKAEHFELCDKAGNCRDSATVMQEDGLATGQPLANIAPAYTESGTVSGVSGSTDSVPSGKVASEILDDGRGGDGGLIYAPCSPSCCTPQYPPPFDIGADNLKDKDKYVPTSYKCNNAWNNSGCLCMTRDQSEFLSSRGGNA